MRKLIVLAGITVAVSAVMGGVTAYAVTKAPSHNVNTEFAAKASDLHLTSYSAQAYPDLTFAAENAVKAVVSVIKTEKVDSYQNMQGFEQFFQFFGVPQGAIQQQPQQQETMSGGSGVIISPDGYIVTNNHVVENATKLKVKLNDGRTFEAKTIGTDPTTDVALIKIDGNDLPIIPFGSSDSLRLGEWVLAIGSPYELQSTVTAGIVSAKSRTLGVIPSNFSIESFIQTDAAVNPGNSGGALVNTRGELVGINTVIKSPTGSYTGYSFAVPETIVRKVVIDLKEYGVVQRAMLGISYKAIDDDFIEQMGKQTGIDQVGGAYVAEVDPNGAAKNAGIEKGDIITEIEGTKIDATSTISELIAKHRPGDKISVTVKRGKNLKHFDVVLRNQTGKAELLKSSDVDAVASLGGTFAELNEKALRKYNINGGVQVTSVTAGGVLSKARIKEGYIITHINDKAVRSIRDIQNLNDKVRTIDGFYPDGRANSYTIVE